MSSMVLARKYRPKGFDTMVGQGHVVQALSNALTQQRLHHAYLFTGTRGVGKTTVSRILAKSLNCVGLDGQGTITASPCGQCQPCRDIDAGRFVDYVELDAASNRGVEEISQLLEQAVYKPVLGRFKVYLIDEVHMLSNTAFNAMLKTLEEPPDYLKFVLATTDPQKVPVTVLSRCLQFNLRPMAAQTVNEHLAQVLTAEAIEYEPEALRLLARAARGSMRDAMSLADQAIAFGGGRLHEGPVRQMLGAVDRQHVQRIIEAVAAGDGAALVGAVDTLRQLGLSASGTLEELAAALQRMAVIQSVPGMAASDDPDEATWRRLAPLLAPDETQLFYSLCLQGRAELALAPDEYSGLVMLMLRLLAFKPRSGSAHQPAHQPVQQTAQQSAHQQGALSPPKFEGSAAARAQQAEPISGRIDQKSSAFAATAAATAAASVAAVGATRASTAPSPAAIESSGPHREGERQGEDGREHGPSSKRPSEPSSERLNGNDERRRAAQSSSGSSQSVPPWEALPPEADAALLADEPPAVVPSDMDMGMGLEGTQTRASVVTSQAARVSDLQRPMSKQAPQDSAQSKTSHTVSLQLPAPGTDPLSDEWADTVAKLHGSGAITALVRELAIQSQCVAREHADGRTSYRLRVERESLCSEANRDRLAQALTQHLGHDARLELERGQAFNTPAQRDLVAREHRQHRAEDIIENDALVKNLLAQYPGARIVPGSIRPI